MKMDLNTIISAEIGHVTERLIPLSKISDKNTISKRKIISV